MRKLIVCILCLCLLSGCAVMPGVTERSLRPRAVEVMAVPAAPKIASRPELRSMPAIPCEPVPMALFMAEPTSEPVPVPAAEPSPVPVQTFTGESLRFDVPEEWIRADATGGVYVFPDVRDVVHNFLYYQEEANKLRLTETSLDVFLMFSSVKSVTAMVEGALTDSGMTDFTLAPVDVEKTSLNGLTCYRGTSSIVLQGESYHFEGYVFLREDKLVLLAWVGDQARYAAGLDIVYRSIQSAPEVSDAERRDDL